MENVDKFGAFRRHGGTKGYFEGENAVSHFGHDIVSLRSKKRGMTPPLRSFGAGSK